MAAMKELIWICVFYTLPGQVTTQIKNVTACYTQSDCSLYNMICQKEQMIQIAEAEYRYRINQTCTDNVCGSGCCPVDEKDCRQHFSEFHATTLYQRCSGKEECLKKQAPEPPQNDQNSECTNTGGYVHIKYECIERSTFMDICNSTQTMKLSEVSIMLLNKTWLTDGESKCICHVQSDKTVKYQLVDVRFFVASTDKHDEYNCTSGTLTINERFITCNKTVNKMFVYMKSDHFIGELKQNSNIIKLTYNENDKPLMVWIRLQAQPYGTFIIQCKTVPSITTTETPSTERDKNDDRKSLPIIVGVVVAAIILIAVVSSALIRLKRRQRKPREDDSLKSEAPSCLINRTSKCIDDSGKSYAMVEYSTYDSINDESVTTYIPPVKKMKDDRGIHEDTTTQGGEVSADEYERIQFKKEFTKTIPNYDHLPAMGGNIRNDTHSHVSNQSEFANAATANASEYSHCKLSSKKIQRNDDDYSHVDLEGAWKKNKHPDSIEEGSYSHIDFA